MMNLTMKAKLAGEKETPLLMNYLKVSPSRSKDASEGIKKRY